MAWNRLVRPIETSLGCHLRGMRAPAHGGNATNHTERPLYLSKLHAKVVGVLQRDWVGFPGTQSRPRYSSLPWGPSGSRHVAGSSDHLSRYQPRDLPPRRPHRGRYGGSPDTQDRHTDGHRRSLTPALRTPPDRHRRCTAVESAGRSLVVARVGVWTEPARVSGWRIRLLPPRVRLPSACVCGVKRAAVAAWQPASHIAPCSSCRCLRKHRCNAAHPKCRGRRCRAARPTY